MCKKNSHFFQTSSPWSIGAGGGGGSKRIISSLHGGIINGFWAASGALGPPECCQRIRLREYLQATNLQEISSRSGDQRQTFLTENAEA